APSNTVTRGPPPSSGVTTTSARPLPVRSPAATYRPPVNDDSNGWVRNSSFRVAPSNTATRPGPPGPAAAPMSSGPSPVTSAGAGGEAAGESGEGGERESFRPGRGVDDHRARPAGVRGGRDQVLGRNGRRNRRWRGHGGRNGRGNSWRNRRWNGGRNGGGHRR